MNIQLAKTFNKVRLTLFVVQKHSTTLETKVLWHEFSHFVEQALEVSLGTNFRRQLQSVDDSLFFLVDFPLGGDFLDLHRQILTNNFENLFIWGVEPLGFISLFVHFGLQLNNEENFIVSKEYWLGYVSECFDTVSDFLEVLVNC